MELSEELHLQLYADRRRCIRVEPAEFDAAPSLIIMVPTAELGSSSSDCRELNLGCIEDVVDVILDADAGSPSLLIDSATYCVTISDDDFAKLSQVQLDYFGFSLEDNVGVLLVDRVFEVPACEVWLDAGLSGAYLAAWFEFEHHTVDWRSVEPELSLFFQAMSVPLKDRLFELKGFRDHDEHLLKFKWRCIGLAGQRFRRAVDCTQLICEIRSAREKLHSGSGSSEHENFSLRKAALLESRPCFPPFDYSNMSFDEVKLVQMVRFNSRGRKINAHIVVNDYGCLLLCADTDVRFAEYCNSLSYVQSVSAYSRWHRSQGFDSPSRFLQKASLTGDYSDVVISPVPLETSLPAVVSSQGSPVVSGFNHSALSVTPCERMDVSGVSGDSGGPVSFSTAASASQFLAAEVVSSIPQMASLKAHEASTEALTGVRVRQFVRIEGLRDYYVLQGRDGVCRKVAAKGNAVHWKAVSNLVSEYNAWHVAEYQALPEDFVCLYDSGSDAESPRSLLKDGIHDASSSEEVEANDALQQALDICRVSGHTVFNKIRVPACWSSTVLDLVLHRGALTEFVPPLPASLKTLVDVPGIFICQNTTRILAECWMLKNNFNPFLASLQFSRASTLNLHFSIQFCR